MNASTKKITIHLRITTKSMNLIQEAIRNGDAVTKSEFIRSAIDAKLKAMNDIWRK